MLIFWFIDSFIFFDKSKQGMKVDATNLSKAVTIINCDLTLVSGYLFTTKELVWIQWVNWSPHNHSIFFLWLNTPIYITYLSNMTVHISNISFLLFPASWLIWYFDCGFTRLYFMKKWKIYQLFFIIFSNFYKFFLKLMTNIYPKIIY